MIIDDDTDDTEIFCEAADCLNNFCDCNAQHSCEEALRYLKMSPTKPDYIFLDINMPKIDGKQCLKLLKADSDLKDIPVIIFSTSNQKSEIDSMLANGATSYITKPSSAEELSHILHNILNTSN